MRTFANVEQDDLDQRLFASHQHKQNSERGAHKGRFTGCYDL